MVMTPQRFRRGMRGLVVDLALIGLVSFVLQATHFSYRQGRSVISGDSAQYVASAKALLSPETTPHFEMRKPGYILFLAAVMSVFGNMGYAVVACQYGLLAALPLAAYGLGRHLHGRALGWAAAGLTAVRLLEVYWAERIMSEVLYCFLFSFGLLAFVAGLARNGSRRWLLMAGLLLGTAWLTRGVATPVIAAGVVVLFLSLRKNLRTALASCAMFIAPIAGCLVVECALNLNFAGQFRPSNGTAGATLLLRARNFEGFDWPATPEAARVAALVPQRDAGEAYVANLLDAWVARYRAVHDLTMTEWEYDTLMGRAGLQLIARHPWPYLRSSARLALGHLARHPDGQTLSPIAAERLSGPLIHPAAAGREDGTEYWFAYWGLPHMALDRSVELVGRMKTSAETRAPFGSSAVWRTLRVVQAMPIVQGIQRGCIWLGSLWPGFALIALAFLRLRARTCAFLAVAYVVDAAFIGLLTPTTARLQFVWIAIDTTMGAVVWTALPCAAISRLRKRTGDATDGRLLAEATGRALDRPT
ncbi:MAG: ArnT family glycosyltransferase [Phycisphaerae bacterium]